MLSKGENDKANATNNALIEMYLNANESKLTSYEEFNMMIESIRSKLNSSCGLNVKSRACSVNGSNVDSEIVRGKYSHLLVLINKDNVKCGCKVSNNKRMKCYVEVLLIKWTQEKKVLYFEWTHREEWAVFAV